MDFSHYLGLEALTLLGRINDEIAFFFSLFKKFYLFIFILFFFISWRLITLQYCSGFCHTLT